MLFLTGIMNAECDASTYNHFCNISRLCRKTLGNQEHAKLQDEDTVQIFVQCSLDFNAVFACHDQITFGSLYFLELPLPTQSDLLIILGDILSASKIIHLNLLCSHQNNYWQDLHMSSWALLLGHLLILRIKYVCSIEEVNFNLNFFVFIVHAHSFGSL